MEQRSDFLVIGSGIAGLTFALNTASRGTVHIVTKREAIASNTLHAQGGIASVWGDDDRFDLHMEDTLKAGDGLCHTDVVEAVVRSGPERIRELIDWGCHFSLKKGKKVYDLGMEGGHSRRRILHAKDHTGREIEEMLLERCREHENIRFFENHVAVDLILESKMSGREETDDDRCWGAYVLERPTGEVRTFLAGATLLASGGAGKVYLYTSNPDIATGDGVAMAYRAGADVGGLEFFQFHPTCLYNPEAKSFLVSEAVRGEGGILKTWSGRAFMEGYDRRRELAPRDIVARAIDSEMKQSGDDCVFLDITHRPAPFIIDRFPHIYENCLSYGVDITKDPIPVVPAAHYMCGGVVTDLRGATTLAGLYAAGEVSFTGLHGANRLASNSLLEAVVYSHVAAESALSALGEKRKMPAAMPWDPGGARAGTEEVVVSQSWDAIRRLMWNYVGIVRSDSRLARAKKQICMIVEDVTEYYYSVLLTANLIELRNIAALAELIIASASQRTESRGLHYNVDHRERDDKNWKRDIILRRGAGEFC